MSSQKYDYLIIGDSAAGVGAVEQIRAYDKQGSILLVSKEPYPAYGRPLISYLLEDKIDEENMWYRPSDFYEKHTIETLRGPQYEVTSLDAASHTVLLKNGVTIPYGKVLLATGSKPSTLPIEGLDEAENVFFFTTLDEAKAVVSAAKKATEEAHVSGRNSVAIIMGTGLIGLKAAEALVGHIDEVIMVSRRWVLPAVLDPQAGSILQKQLSKHGISFHTGAAAQEVERKGKKVSAVKLSDGTVLECDIVISALGVKPDTALAVDAGAQEGRGLICGPDLQTSLPDVYAAGDVTQVNNTLDGSQRPIALWQNAVRQGRIAGAFMAQDPDAQPFEGNFPVNATYFFGFPLLTCGVTNPPEEAGYEEHIDADENTYVKFVTKGDRLMGYILLNRAEQAGIYTAIIEGKLPLSTLEETLFDQAPENLCFPPTLRWERLHKGYPSVLISSPGKESA